jgi:hypothetical protein
MSRRLSLGIFAGITLVLIGATSAWALYDPKPVAPLSLMEGMWSGTLTYQDYAKPDRQVRLPTKLFATMAEPAKIVLHFIYDDGPSKTVHSYDNLSLDLEAKIALWAEEAGAPPVRYTIAKYIENTADNSFTLVIEANITKPNRQPFARETITISKTTLAFERLTGTGAEDLHFANGYSFTRLP